MPPAAPATEAAAAGPDQAKGSLADPAVRRQRLALLDAPHASPIAAYVRHLRAQDRGYVPDFDPLDGGTGARMLVVLEKPGPRTVPPAGSGFVSRDTDDPTARTLGRFMEQAGVPRSGVAVWNVVPWWNGTMAMTTAEKRLGAAQLAELLPLLPALRVAILAGNAAWEAARPHLHGLRLVRCVHPSNQARAGPASRDGWLQLPTIWRNAWALAASAGEPGCCIDAAPPTPRDEGPAP